MRVLAWASGCLVLLALASCGSSPLAAEPPAEPPAITVPDLVAADREAAAVAARKLPTLARDSADRRARTLTVRLRNTSCAGVAVGSGFAIDRDTLITNRHVLAGASRLAVSTWDGETLDVDSAVVGVLGDIGIVDVAGRLPRPGRYGLSSRSGDIVTVVGYPLGGKLTLRRGLVVDRVEGSRFDVPGSVLRLTAFVQPGNSGGPVLDQRGRIVAVVFAIELATGYALAIPVETMRALIDTGGLEPVPPCGSE